MNNQWFSGSIYRPTLENESSRNQVWTESTVRFFGPNSRHPARHQKTVGIFDQALVPESGHRFNSTVLPGDGMGPEMVAQALRIPELATSKVLGYCRPMISGESQSTKHTQSMHNGPRHTNG